MCCDYVLVLYSAIGEHENLCESLLRSVDVNSNSSAKYIQMAMLLVGMLISQTGLALAVTSSVLNDASATRDR